jgi:hypothetical protein
MAKPILPQIPFENPGIGRIIEMNRGFSTIVDEEDFGWLSEFNWFITGIDKGNASLYYARRNAKIINGTRSPAVMMHVAIIGRKPGFVTDHKNENGLDNRKENLRICLQSQNTARRKWGPRRSSSGYRGVSQNGDGNWYVRASYDYVGTFATELEAAIAYNRFAREKYGEFASLNPVEDDGRVIVSLPKRGHPAAVVNSIVKMYKDGMTIREIERDLKISYQTIYTILGRLGLRHA